MKVINQTRNTILTENIIQPISLLDQTLGLLKHKTPTAMLLKTRFGIHTFGMKYPIDIVILDKENKVVVLKENLKPNLIFIWNFKYETILELPEGTIQKTKTEIDDTLLFR